MPSSSSSSSFSSSSSSSYHGFVVNQNQVEAYGKFEIIAQNLNWVLINSGRGYDGYGNMLAKAERTAQTMTFPADCGVDGDGDIFGYLCVKRQAAPLLIDYQDDPLYRLPKPTKFVPVIEFYVSATVMAVDFGSSQYGYYPQPDSNGIIPGIVIGKLFKDAAKKPDMTYRSPLLAVKDGQFLPIEGFNLF